MADAKEEKKEEKKHEPSAPITPLSCDLSALVEIASTFLVSRNELKPEQVEILARVGLLNALKSHTNRAGRYDRVYASLYLIKATESADIPARQMALAICYREGFIETENRDRKAFELLQQAVKGGYIWAKPLLAQMYAEKGDHGAAYNLLVEAANSQLAFAQSELSQVLLQGEHVAKNIELARQFAEAAAKQKWQPAAKTLSSLGMDYLKGTREVKQDIPKAIRLLTEAGELGDGSALRVLAQCYYGGHGVPRDRKQGVKLFYEAMRQGDEKAKYELAQMVTDFLDRDGTYRLVSSSAPLREVLRKFVFYNLIDSGHIHGYKAPGVQNADELEAISILEELVGSVENCTNSVELVLLGDLYEKHGMLSEAKKCFLHAATQLSNNEALSRLLAMKDRDGILPDAERIRELQQESSELGDAEATRTLMVHYFENLHRIWLQTHAADASPEEKKKLQQELLAQGIAAALDLRGATTFASPRFYQDVEEFFGKFGLFTDPAIIYHCRVVMLCNITEGEKISLDYLTTLLRSSPQECLQLIETDLQSGPIITRTVASLVCRFLKDKSRNFPEIDRLKACYGNHCIRIGCFEQGFRSICELDPKHLLPDENYWVGVHLFQYSNPSDPLKEAVFHDKGLMHLCKAAQAESEAAWKFLRGTIDREVASGSVSEDEKQAILKKYSKYFAQLGEQKGPVRVRALDDNDSKEHVTPPAAPASLAASSSSVDRGEILSISGSSASSVGSSSGVGYKASGAFFSTPPRRASNQPEPDNKPADSKESKEPNDSKEVKVRK